MKIINYNDIEITLLQYTHNYKYILETALNITMKQNFQNITNKNFEKRIKFIINANHTSILEHIYFTFLIKNASRSFLAQITRHRIASFTSGSQHYQIYNNYNFIIDNIDDIYYKKMIYKTIESNIILYKFLIDNNIDKSEARQILPNGMTNNLMFSINARSLINFLNLRLCKRNTKEILIVSEIILQICKEIMPEIFNYVGADCFMTKCKQGSMRCKNEKK